MDGAAVISSHHVGMIYNCGIAELFQTICKIVLHAFQRAVFTMSFLAIAAVLAD